MPETVKIAADKEGWGAPILLLTWVAGTIDAIGYLSLGHVFTANMTGNAVLLGLALGQGQAPAAFRSLFALGGFALGVTAGAILAHRSGTDVDQRRAFLGPILVETIILAAFALTFHLPFLPRNQFTLHVLIGLSAVAMGIQSAAVRRLNLPGIATTVLTGTITSFVAGIVRWLHLTYVSSPSEEAATKSAGRRAQLGLQAGVFLVYVLAAVSAGIFQRRVPLIVGLSPVVAIGLVLLGATLSTARPKIISQ
ncbi:MAG: YoaK family protein [Candidatus Acidiferrales bacterium]